MIKESSAQRTAKRTVAPKRGTQTKGLLMTIPDRINDSLVLETLQKHSIDGRYLSAIHDFTSFTDDVVGGWLNLSGRTVRAYRGAKEKVELKENVQEHILLLLALFKHGEQVFGSAAALEQWLNKGNFYFDGKTPASFLTTITGIKFVDARLTAMEYGDNV